ncbi:hypothetical protein SAMN05444396_101410 [Flavobacterium segetis]|uniref:Uncharacterized protein n=1 Tax=Flavobacterium segetis TaxID=271157 RepID=A0A1M5EIY0_9FLAO|nr:hypothetical protein [Flavobacterium segetis]SHF79116.1 hypothetical protein SAMN05444396_101410 [Flavobacterium segetis]
MKKLPLISFKNSQIILVKGRKVVYLIMQHITGIPRNQIYFYHEASGLEDIISSENPIRFIDAFVAASSLEALGFSVQTIKSEGRPSFDTKIFLVQNRKFTSDSGF